MKNIIYIDNKEYTYDSINQTLKIEEGGKIIFNKSLHVVRSLKKYKNLKNIVEKIKKSIPDNILELRFKCYNSLPNKHNVLIDNNKIKYVKIRFTLMSKNNIKKELIINKGKPKIIKKFQLFDNIEKESSSLRFSINNNKVDLFPCNRYPESIIEQIDRIENQIKQRQRRNNRNDEQDEEKEEPINIYDLDDPTPPDDAMDIDDPTPPDDPMRGLE